MEAAEFPIQFQGDPLQLSCNSSWDQLNFLILAARAMLQLLTTSFNNTWTRAEQSTQLDMTQWVGYVKKVFPSITIPVVLSFREANNDHQAGFPTSTSTMCSHVLV